MVESVTLVLIAALGCLLVALFATQPRRGARRSRQQLALETEGVLLSTSKLCPGRIEGSKPPVLVMGQAVIAGNNLVVLLGRLKKIIGGEMGLYTHLSSWASQLALLRMVQQAKKLGYNAVSNVRIETSDLGEAFGKGKTVLVEVIAFGTAYDARL